MDWVDSTGHKIIYKKYAQIFVRGHYPRSEQFSESEAQGKL